MTLTIPTATPVYAHNQPIGLIVRSPRQTITISDVAPGAKLKAFVFSWRDQKFYEQAPVINNQCVVVLGNDVHAYGHYYVSVRNLAGDEVTLHVFRIND